MADTKVIYRWVMTKTSRLFRKLTGFSHYKPVQLGHDTIMNQ